MVLDCEVIYTSQAGYSYRVMLEGIWIASAKTYHAGDLVLIEYLSLLAEEQEGASPLDLEHIPIPWGE